MCTLLVCILYSIKYSNYVVLKVMSKLVNFLSFLNPLELHSDNFARELHRSGGTNKDPIIGLVEASPPLSMFSKAICV